MGTLLFFLFKIWWCSCICIPFVLGRTERLINSSSSSDHPPDQRCDASTESILEIFFHRSEIRRQQVAFDVQLASKQTSTWLSGTLYGIKLGGDEHEKTWHEFVCIPKLECYVVTIRNLFLSEFELYWDGQPLETNLTNQFQGFQFLEKGNTIWTTRIGTTCIPACLPEETLFQVSAFALDSDVDWRLEDADTGQVLAECSSTKNLPCSWQGTGLYSSNHCLSSSGCYRLIRGDITWSIWGPSGKYNLKQPPVWFVSWDGERIGIDQSHHGAATSFDALDFGGGPSCGRQSRASSCPPNQGLFELFLYRFPSYNGDRYPDISWTLTDKANHRPTNSYEHTISPADNTTDQPQMVVADGRIASNDAQLQYASRCVALDSCFTFSAIVPETLGIPRESKPTDFYQYSQEVKYRLSLDGTVFVDHRYNYWGEHPSTRAASTRNKFAETAHLGKCSPQDICNTHNETLLHLQIGTRNETDHHVRWAVRNVSHPPNDREHLLSSQVFLRSPVQGYFSDVPYQYYECLPKKAGCLVFDILKKDVDRAEAEYRIVVDGEELKQRKLGLEKIFSGSYDKYGTHLTRNGSCPSEKYTRWALSLGSVVEAALVVYVVFMASRRMSKAPWRRAVSREAREINRDDSNGTTIEMGSMETSAFLSSSVHDDAYQHSR